MEDSPPGIQPQANALAGGEPVSPPKNIEDYEKCLFVLHFLGSNSPPDLDDILNRLQRDWRDQPGARVACLRALWEDPLVTELWEPVFEVWPDCPACTFLALRGALLSSGYKGLGTGPVQDQFRKRGIRLDLLPRSWIRATEPWGIESHDYECHLAYGNDLRVDAYNALCKLGQERVDLLPVVLAATPEYWTFKPELDFAFAWDSDRALLAHPDFPLEDYVLPPSGLERWRTRTAPGAKPSRRELASGRNLTEWEHRGSDDDVAHLIEIAEDAGEPYQQGTNINWRARGALIRLAERSPSADAWVRKQLQTASGDPGWVRAIAYFSRAVDLIRPILPPLFEEGDAYTLANTVQRFIECHGENPPEDGIDLLLRVISLQTDYRRWELWAYLYRTYPGVARVQAAALEALRAARHEPDAALKLAAEMLQSGFATEEVLEISGDMLAAGIDGGSVRDLFRVLSKSPHRRLREALVELLARPGSKNSEKGIGYWLDLPPENPSPELIRLVETSYRDVKWLAWVYRHDPAKHAELLVGSDKWPRNRPALGAFLHEMETGRPIELEESNRRRLLDIVRDPANKTHFYNDYIELALWFGEDPEAKAALLSAALHRPPALNVAKFRWPDCPEVLGLVRDAMDHPDREMREEAAFLLCLFHCDSVEYLERVRAHLHESPAILAEYLAARYSDLDAMHLGLELLGRPPSEILDEDVLRCGPSLLVRYFGPRRDLIDQLGRMAIASTSSALRDGVLMALRVWHPNSAFLTLHSLVPEARAEQLSALPPSPESVATAIQFLEADPDLGVARSAMDYLFLHGTPSDLPLARVRRVAAAADEASSKLFDKWCETHPDALPDLLAFGPGLQSPFAGPCPTLTRLIATHYTTDAAAIPYLLQRFDGADTDAEMGNVVIGLSAHMTAVAGLRDRLLQVCQDKGISTSASARFLEYDMKGLEGESRIDALIQFIPIDCTADPGFVVAVCCKMIDALSDEEINTASPVAVKVGAWFMEMWQFAPRKRIRGIGFDALGSGLFYRCKPENSNRYSIYKDFSRLWRAELGISTTD